MFSYRIFISIILKKSCLKEKQVFCVIISEHSRIHICCSTIQNICCCGNIPVSSCESSSSGPTHVLQGRIGCNHKDLEVSARGLSEWLLGGALCISECPVAISFIAKASVLW